eukprot:m.375453 g.375453  ORF g.375453 m.375453 type:complete len:210 (+) comp16698_c1_seq2:64-693(+)
MTDADARTVEQYLVSQNRPWNVGSLVLNLHKAVGKTAAETVLTKLSSGDDSSIVELVNGKQKVYYARQKGEVNAEELAELTAEIEKKKVAVEELKREVSGLAARKTALAAEPTDADLVAAVEEMSKATHADRQRLAELKKTAGSLSPKKLKQIKDGHTKMVGLWRKRKRMCNDIVDQVLENANKKPKELMEEMGIETDADVGVDIKTFG